MANRDTYAAQEWEDLPSEKTPLKAERLLHIESGIKEATDKRALKEIYDDESINLGLQNQATGFYAFAQGNMVIVSGDNAFGQGDHIKVSGFSANARGTYSNALATCSNAQGMYVTASGYCSHAGGYQSVANGNTSFADGYYVTANGDYQHVQGKYNIPDISNKYAYIIGGGTSEEDRKNVFTVDWHGNALLAGGAQLTGDLRITFNDRTISLYGLQMEVEGRAKALQSQIDTIRVQSAPAKVFETKTALDEWLAIEGNPETLIAGQNIYIVATGTPDYWWDGTGLQELEPDKVTIETMTYDETMAILNSTETSIKKIPDLSAIRDWCKSMFQSAGNV